METSNWTNDSHRILENATELKLYNRWLVSNFANFFGQNTLEIGSGLGGLSALIPSENLVLSDLREDYFEFLKKRFKKITLKLDIEKESPEKLQNQFDSIFSSNVFEHIQDDQSAFRNSFNLLKPGGYLLLYVPGSPSIFGQLDREMGHFRRYTKTEVIHKAMKAGFEIEVVRYANLFGYFTWWGRGVLLSRFIKSKSGSSRIDKILGHLFETITLPFLYLEKNIDLPLGQNIVAILRKP